MKSVQKKSPVEQQMLVSFWVTLAVLFLVAGVAMNYAAQFIAAVIFIAASISLLLAFLILQHIKIRRLILGQQEEEQALFQMRLPLLKAGALQDAIFNSANFSSIATDEKGVIQIFNVGAERMLGYKAGDVVDKITPANISEPKEVIARAAALSLELDTPIAPGFEALVFKASRGIEDIYELTYIRKDGSRFPAVVSVTALRDKRDTIIGYLLIGTDNTARKQAEEALLRAGALQNAIFNSANFSSIATDANGVIQIFNVGAERMLGYSAEDVINKITPANISDPQEVIARAASLSLELDTPIAPGFEALVFKASRGIEDIYELTYIRKDGSRFPAVVSVTALRDNQDSIIGYLLIGTDNTARKQAEEALLRAGALQNAIFNSANFSSIATDAKGVIQIFNVGAERMLGYAAADVMNKITPADISDPQEVIARAASLSLELDTPIAPGFEALVFKASRGIEDIYELTYIRKDGSSFPAVVSVTALRNDQDSIIGYLLIGTDNTARKQVEAEQTKLDQRLRDQQFYTRSLIESNIDAIMTTDPRGIISDVNQQMQSLTGCTRDELIGAPFKKYFTDTSRAESAIARVLREGKITNFELIVHARDGRQTAVSFNATTFHDRDRKLQGVFAAARDVTDIKKSDISPTTSTTELDFLALLNVRTREAIHNRWTDELGLQGMSQPLLKAGALQNAIFNSANFSCVATDAHGVIQIFNVGAERMLGYKAEDVINKITPADISDPQEVIARAASLSLELNAQITPGFEALVFKASRGIEDIYELTYIRKDGSSFPAIVSVTALRDDEGSIIGYLLIGTDNTARKQVEAEQTIVEQRLRDQQFYTRSLIESNIDAIMTTDLRGIISDVNQQMEALTGCTRDELIGAPFRNYFTDTARAEASITRVLREGKLTNYELTAQARDGNETVVSVNATTFHDRNRKLQGVFAAARDVTDRKQFEMVLEENNVELKIAKAAAETANVAKSEFLSSMSHELRTPLNAVLGFAQLMASEAPPPSPSQKLSIDQILQAGWYLLRLINEILDLAMIESGKVTVSKESMSLTELLQDCHAMIEPQALRREIKMTFPALDNPFYIYADRTRVKQVMINLLSNAIKYNRDGGEVTVQCYARRDSRVRVCVKDTGAGLAPEQVAQLFQPFNRLGQEAGSEEGTGIGLVVTKQLVELMGGDIGVESSTGIGSVFWVELPGANAPELEGDNLEKLGSVALDILPDDESSSQRTLLYVEDNPANLALVEQLIARRSDLKMLTAKDGHTGVNLARAYLPDVILMDINLPGMSGYGALEILRKDPVTAHIPIMALSANAIPREVEKGLEAGFFRYLTKPIKVVEFMDALEVALNFAAENGLASKATTVG